MMTGFIKNCIPCRKPDIGCQNPSPHTQTQNPNYSESEKAAAKTCGFFIFLLCHIQTQGILGLLIEKE